MVTTESGFTRILKLVMDRVLLLDFSSLEKGQLYILQVGSGQVIKGLDEGILSMKVGGKRRLYVPEPLAFPKGLASASGRPRVVADTVVFDVSLEYIPGLEDDE
ncbi:Peptidyl-prolyl cis-trans isomerase FKBP16-3-chloroplastic [Striga hermonthica]|uniref:peptidylprolyl isomerase n=1 Tax=Striga hermonthica TaxID=68872 RepID=A0A9N7NWM7_STRHE|nr:Peptidyl-prolyl cis-trans isomerase FKBP16-3-chloroplastic [Striga hermonthica]